MGGPEWNTHPGELAECRMAKVEVVREYRLSVLRPGVSDRIGGLPRLPLQIA
jgi:hypothetical protein